MPCLKDSRSNELGELLISHIKFEACTCVVLADFLQGGISEEGPASVAWGMSKAHFMLTRPLLPSFHIPQETQHCNIDTDRLPISPPHSLKARKLTFNIHPPQPQSRAWRSLAWKPCSCLDDHAAAKCPKIHSALRPLDGIAGEHIRDVQA